MVWVFQHSVSKVGFLSFVEKPFSMAKFYLDEEDFKVTYISKTTDSLTKDCTNVFVVI